MLTGRIFPAGPGVHWKGADGLAVKLDTNDFIPGILDLCIRTFGLCCNGLTRPGVTEETGQVRPFHGTGTDGEHRVLLSVALPIDSRTAVVHYAIPPYE